MCLWGPERYLTPLPWNETVGSQTGVVEGATLSPLGSFFPLPVELGAQGEISQAFLAFFKPLADLYLSIRGLTLMTGMMAFSSQ